MPVVLPDLRPDGIANESPHIVILGAGASLAACPNGDWYGRRLPVMANLVETVGLTQTLRRAGFPVNPTTNFEDLYSQIASDPKRQDLQVQVETSIREYFDNLELPKYATLYDRLLLSLRRKDMVATFNWDPFLAHAYMRNSRAAWLPEIVWVRVFCD